MSQFFGSGPARYDLAKPRPFKLAPPPARLAGLGRDYQVMRDMVFSQPMDFERILAALSDLERRINGVVGP